MFHKFLCRGLSAGDIDVFRKSDAVFWVTFCCVTLIVPLFFVRWPREVTDLTLQELEVFKGF